MPSASAYLDMILNSTHLSNESGFRGVCRLVFSKFENDVYFIGHQPKTKAYDIVSNTLDMYYGNNKPITKREIADIIGLKTLGRWSTTAGNRKEHTDFQQKLKQFVNEMKTRI